MASYHHLYRDSTAGLHSPLADVILLAAIGIRAGGGTCGLVDRRLRNCARACSPLGQSSAGSADDVVLSARVRSNVVVRAEPLGAPSAPIGVLRPGEEAELLESIPYFYRVRLPNGVTGYVSKSWTDLVQSVSGPGQLTLHFIDVGQGDSTLAICPNGSTILIDAGSTSGRSPDEVRQYLIGQIDPYGTEIDTSLSPIPTPIITTSCRRCLTRYRSAERITSVSAATTATGRFLTGFSPHLPLRPSSAQPTMTGWKHQTARSIAEQPKCGFFAAGVEHPESRKNAMSIVVMFRMGDFEAVITGDATFATENVILSRYTPAWLDIDVLRVGAPWQFRYLNVEAVGRCSDAKDCHRQCGL